jgi:glutaredoxin
MSALTLFGRAECHLCEQALLLLAQADLAVSVVDIDDDAALGAYYGLRVPVLRHADGRELDWPFDLEALEMMRSSAHS